MMFFILFISRIFYWFSLQWSLIMIRDPFFKQNHPSPLHASIVLDFSL